MSHLPSVWIAAALTLAIFTFLHRDNPIFRIAESLYQKVGSSAGAGSGRSEGDGSPGGGTGASGAGSRKDGDVIDAEYVDVDEPKR